MLTLGPLIALVALCAQAVAQGQGQGQAEDDSPDLTHAEWNQLDALYTHFGKLSHEWHRDWFKTSNPCDWRRIECNKQGKMKLDIWILHPNELQASRPVTHALSNVAGLTLTFADNEYPELDLANVARLFPNLEELMIWCDSRVKSFANLGALTQMPLEKLYVYYIGMPFPLAEWLPHMEHLKFLKLSSLSIDSEPPDFDLRGLIPPTLEDFWIELLTNHPEVPRVLLSDDLITARERADGSVIHPLTLLFHPSSKFLSYEMECRALNPDSRPIESKQERPGGKHPLTILYDLEEDEPKIADRPMSKFAVLKNLYFLR